jgi:hypothetical protein
MGEEIKIYVAKIMEIRKKEDGKRERRGLRYVGCRLIRPWCVEV